MADTNDSVVESLEWYDLALLEELWVSERVKGTDNVLFFSDFD